MPPASEALCGEAGRRKPKDLSNVMGVRSMSGEAREWLGYVVVAPFPILLLWAMATDVSRFQIPNRIPIILFCAFPVATFSLGQDLSEDLIIILQQCGIAAAFLFVGMLLFWRGFVGGGDVKLLSAVVPWLAPAQLPSYLFLMAVLGGILGLLALALRRLPVPARLSDNGWVKAFKESNKIPYGVAIGCAGLITLPNLPLLTN